MIQRGSPPPMVVAGEEYTGDDGPGGSKGGAWASGEE